MGRRPRIGFAKRDITPPVLPEGDLSIPMLGWHRERAKAYREVHDPLYVRAMGIVSGGHSAVILACDLFGDAIGFTGRSAEEVQGRCGVSAEHVFFGCTHTHTSPDTLKICRKEIAAWWIDELAGKLAEAATAAIEKARPGTLHWSEVRVPGLVVNRRARFVSAYEKEHGPVEPRVRERNTALDETLRIIAAVDSTGRPFGAVLNFACHPVIMQTMPMISADFCGVATGEVEKLFDKNFICLYLNGPCGDINPICGDTREYQDCERTGAALASQAVSTIHESIAADPLDIDPIAGRVEFVETERQELRDPDALRAEERRLAEECLRADAAGLTSRDERHPLRRMVLIQEQLAVGEMPRVQKAPVHALRLGEVRLVSFPGEVLTALGQDVRRGIGGKVMLGHCARAHLGYICPREAYRIGGYETGPGTWSWLKQGCGERIAEAAVELSGTL